MNIGTVAERSGVPPKTIRYYESIGLIPSADRRPNGYRTYSVVDTHTLNFIRRARSLGFSVDEVRDLLELWRNKRRTSSAVKALATRHLGELDRKITEIQTMRRALADLVERCRGDERPECPILDDFSHDRNGSAERDASSDLRERQVSKS
jgi:MerR family copper efflux transcriptional regulator